jgi:hypothetical protein
MLRLLLRGIEMKLHIVRNQNQPDDGRQSVHISVDMVAQNITATLLFSEYVGSDTGEEAIELGGKTWQVRDRKTISFIELKNLREFADRTAFMLGIDWLKNKWAQGLIPLYTISVDSKLTAVDLVKTGLVPPLVLGINVPFADAGFNDCHLTVNIPSATGQCFVDGLTPSDVLQSPYSTSGLVREMVIFPHLEVTGPDSVPAGDQIEFGVQVIDAAGNALTRDVTLHLESVNGLLPKNRIRTTDGQATVKLFTTGLAAGDSVRLKAGFKFFAGAADKEVILT